MSIIYVCRHCNTYVGEVDPLRVADAQLGFHSLTPEERTDIISYNSDNDVTYVKTVCDYCQQALENNPELVLLRNPLQ